jgi:glycosyltransferase involved in cell wall biosynthesis
MKETTLLAIVLTKNEERDLPACLASLENLATEIYVIDSGSTDRTVAIAAEYGARVLSHPFTNHAAQFNWALVNIVSSAAWVIRIDADERLSEGLRTELCAALNQSADAVTGFEVPRRIRFLGRNLRFGDTYPIWLLRVWRNGCARCEDRQMDEHMVLHHGESRRLQGDLLHEIPKSLTEWTAKHNWYATRECADILSLKLAELPQGAAGARRLKRSVYLRFPLFYRAFAYWAYRYILRLGFLDGRAGLIYHFLQGFWYRFLVDAKLYESQATGGTDTLPARSEGERPAGPQSCAAGGCPKPDPFNL